MLSAGPVVEYSDLGPLSVREPPLSARLRVHQAWYRRTILGLERFGALPPPSGRPLGSVLAPADASAHLNFVAEHASSMYTSRRHAGWGLEPFRCTSVMTSSQTLTINLFSTLLNWPGWTESVLSEVLGLPVSSILDRELEFAPARRSEYLHDMTRVDFLLRVLIDDTERHIVFETKYADRHVSRVPRIGSAYAALAGRRSLWRPGALELVPRRLNQPLRCHALAAAISEKLGVVAEPIYVLVAHGADRDARRIVDDYASLLADPSLVRLLHLDELLESMARTQPSSAAASACEALRLRYVDLEASDAVWAQRTTT